MSITSFQYKLSVRRIQGFSKKLLIKIPDFLLNAILDGNYQVINNFKCHYSFLKSKFGKSYYPFYMMAEDCMQDTFPVSHFKFPLPETSGVQQKPVNNFCCINFDGTKWEKKSKKTKREIERKKVNVLNTSTCLSIHSHTVEDIETKNDQLKIILSPKVNTGKKIEKVHNKIVKKKRKIIVTSSTINVEGLKPPVKDQEQQTEISCAMINDIKINEKKVKEWKFVDMLLKSKDLKTSDIKKLLRSLYKIEDTPKCNLTRVTLPSIEIIDIFKDETQTKPKLPQRRLGERELVELFENSKKQPVNEREVVDKQQTRPKIPRKFIGKKVEQPEEDKIESDPNQRPSMPRKRVEHVSENTSDDNGSTGNLIHNSIYSSNDPINSNVSDATINSHNRDVYKWVVQADVKTDGTIPQEVEKKETKGVQVTEISKDEIIEKLKMERNNLNEKIIQGFMDMKIKENQEIKNELINLSKLITQKNENPPDEKKNIEIIEDYPKLLMTKEANNNCMEYLNTVKRTVKDNQLIDDVLEPIENRSYIIHNVRTNIITNSTIAPEKIPVVDPKESSLTFTKPLSPRPLKTKSFIKITPKPEKIVENEINVFPSEPIKETMEKIDVHVNLVQEHELKKQNNINKQFIKEKAKITTTIFRSNTCPMLKNTATKAINSRKLSRLPVTKAKTNKLKQIKGSENSIQSKGVIVSSSQNNSKEKWNPGSINNSTFLFTKVNKDVNKDSSFKKRKEYYKKLKEQCVFLQKQQEKNIKDENTASIENKWERNRDFCVNFCFSKYTNLVEQQYNNHYSWINTREFKSVSQGSLESGIGSCIASTIVSHSPPLQNVGSGDNVELKKDEVSSIDSNLTLKQIDVDDNILLNKSSTECFNKNSDWCSASDSEDNMVVCKRKKKSKTSGRGRRVWCNIKCFFSKSVFHKNHHKKMN